MVQQAIWTINEGDHTADIACSTHRFHCTTHMASVLCGVQKKSDDARSMINTATNPKMLDNELFHIHDAWDLD